MWRGDNSLNRQIPPNPKTLVTDSWALKASLEVALNICLREHWFLLEVLTPAPESTWMNFFLLHPMFSQGIEDDPGTTIRLSPAILNPE